MEPSCCRSIRLQQQSCSSLAAGPSLHSLEAWSCAGRAGAHLDLGRAGRRARQAIEMELAQQLIAGGQAVVALVQQQADGALARVRGCEHLSPSGEWHV